MPATDPRWAESVIEGRPPPARTAHSAAVLDNRLFVYGGTDPYSRIHDDLWTLPLTENPFKWSLVCRGPGPRKYHSMVVHDKRMWVFGGKGYFGEGGLFWLTPDGKWEWVIEQTKGGDVEGHFAGLWGDKMLVFGGIDKKTMNFTNRVSAFTFKDKGWEEITPTGLIQARANCAADIIQNKLYVFGGDSDSGVRNDFYQLDLLKSIWTRVEALSSPSPRRGCTMAAYKTTLYVFGGIEQVTKQKNDMFAYQREAGRWVNINKENLDTYQCSPTLAPTRNRRLLEQKNQKLNELTQKRTVQLNAYDSSPARQPPIKSRSLSNDKLSVEARMRQIRVDHKNKLAMAFKSSLLSNFPKEQQKRATKLPRKLSPASKAVIDTLTMVGQQENRELHELISKYQEQGRTSRIINGRMLEGKRPCARDGHTMTRHSRWLLIFGGDRHTMVLNDLLWFDTDIAMAHMQPYN